MARVTDRRWIALDHHGVAILARALSEIQWSDASNEAEILAAAACLQCQDPPGEISAWLATHGMAAGVDHGPASNSPSPVRAIHKETVVSVRPKDFHWTEEHFKSFPALWAHCAGGLPVSADWIDQETPIAKRQEQDDVVKSMVPIFAELAAQHMHQSIAVWVRPVRDSHVYERLLFSRETERPTSRAGAPRLQDGTELAAIMALEHMRYYSSDDRKISMAEAARWVIVRHIGWVEKDNSPGPRDHRVVVDLEREDGDGARLAAVKVARRMRAIDRDFREFEGERKSDETRPRNKQGRRDLFSIWPVRTQQSKLG